MNDTDVLYGSVCLSLVTLVYVNLTQLIYGEETVWTNKELRRRLFWMLIFQMCAATYVGYLSGFRWAFDSVDYMFQIVLGFIFPFVETAWKYMQRWVSKKGNVSPVLSLTFKAKNPLMVIYSFVMINNLSTMYFIVLIVPAARNFYSIIFLLLAKSMLIVEYTFRASEYYWIRYINTRLNASIMDTEERTKVTSFLYKIYMP